LEPLQLAVRLLEAHLHLVEALVLRAPRTPAHRVSGSGQVARYAELGVACALLAVSDHGDRRRLAREAAAGNWSVRALEARTRSARGERGSGSGKRRSRRMHPDQAAAIEQLEDVLEQALAASVRVIPVADGYRIQLDVESLEDALDLARRLRLRAV